MLLTLLLQKGMCASHWAWCRRMGENLVSLDPGDTRPQRFRENTVRSFVQAAQVGASFVEFDVQVSGASAHVSCRTCHPTGALLLLFCCCMLSYRSGEKVLCSKGANVTFETCSIMSAGA